MKPNRNPDQVVWTVVWLLGWAQVILAGPLYMWQAWLRGFPDRAGSYFNYFYAFEWAVILASLAVLQATCSGGWVTVLVALGALWRIAEVIVWYSKMLLDRGHKLLLTPERNLLFLIFNSAETVTALSLLLTLDGRPLPGAWLEALTLITLNPIDNGGGWVSAAAVLGIVLGLTLLLAGLAVLIGIIGERFVTGGLRYEGGTRPLRPPRLGGKRPPYARATVVPRFPFRRR